MATAPDQLRVSPLKPNVRTSAADLPREILQGLSVLQREGLAFATRRLKVTSARVQTFQMGSRSKGKVSLVGVDRTLGQYWGAFGAVGGINQLSLNEFRTDIQVKLEDVSGERFFLNYSLPFAITLALDPGDILELYFVRGGLRTTFIEGDFICNEWTAFAAQSIGTGQFVPIGVLPSLAEPASTLLWIGAVTGVIGFVMLEASLVLSVLLWIFSAVFITIYIVRKRRYLKDFRRSRQASLAASV